MDTNSHPSSPSGTVDHARNGRDRAQAQQSPSPSAGQPAAAPALTEPPVNRKRQPPVPTEVPARVPWLAVAVFAILACGLAWLATLPLWLGEGLQSPLFMPSALVMMYTPTIAAFIVMFTILRPVRKARYLGLVPFRPVGKKIALFLLWPVIWLALGFGAFFLAVGLGWAEPDWSLSALSSMVPPGMTLEMMVIVSFAILPINVIVSSVAAFGEELGWRGFLNTALAPLGFWRAALFSGVLWGVWHAPLILLGYNFQRTDAIGVLLMTGFTMFVGVLLQWSRYWTGNVWPAVVGHGALNAVTPTTFLWSSTGMDPTVSTILGYPGWIVMGIAILVLFLFGVLGRRGSRIAGTVTAAS